MFSKKISAEQIPADLWQGDLKQSLYSFPEELIFLIDPEEEVNKIDLFIPSILYYFKGYNDIKK